MKKLDVSGKKVDVDDDGFLARIDDWNEIVAKALAENEGVENINKEQLEIIRFMRDYYIKFHAFPILNYVCKNLHKSRGCVSEQFIDPMKSWKIAGLPKMDNIHFVAVDGKHFIMEECC